MATGKGGQSAPILTMSTDLPDRELISIDGRDYELARYHDLSLHKHGKFSRAYFRALDLYGEFFETDKDGHSSADDLSDEDADFLEQRTGEAFTDATMLIVRTCPREAIEKLTIEQRMQVCGAFQRAVNRWRRGPGAPPATEEAATATGDASSTPSPPVSGAAPAGGSGELASESSLRPTGD